MLEMGANSLGKLYSVIPSRGPKPCHVAFCLLTVRVLQEAGDREPNAGSAFRGPLPWQGPTEVTVGI